MVRPAVAVRLVESLLFAELFDRHYLGAVVGLEDFIFCRAPYHIRLSQPHPVLLAES